MADVLLARTDGIEGFERHVVLKRIRAEHARDPHFIKMFLDEARVAANLHHQHIVQVNDIGEANGQYFFAMEYLHGEDVRALLSAASRAKTHLPLGVVVAIGSAAAAGLYYAHERRTPDKRPLHIVHCDVSPSNVLVGYDGSIKVVDFGIAKAALRGGDGRSGFLTGKASYMSPEQCTGGPIDRRSDVFALGIVLYELATTTRLFKATNEVAVMDAIVKGRAPLPRVRRPDLPNELAMIIMRALATDPERRYQTADELRVALDRFAEGAGLATSAAAVASVLKKMFGERPEPWLDLANARLDTKSSWTELPVMDTGGHRISELALATGRMPVHARSDTTPPMIAAMQVAASPAAAPRGAEASPEAPAVVPPRQRVPKKLVMIAAPLFAVAVAGVAVVAASGGGGAAGTASVAAGAAAGAAAAAVAAPQVPSVEPIAPGREMTVEPAARGAAAAKTKNEEQASEVAVAPPAGTSAVAAKRGKAAVAAPGSPSAKAASAPAPASTAPAELAAATSPAPAPAASASASASAPATLPITSPGAAPPAPAPAPAPAPPPPPAITAMPAKPAAPDASAALAIPVIPQVLVNRVAWESSRELSKCEGKDTLKGEVTVKFMVAPDGRVTQPQIATKMGKPKLAACILRSIARWRFPSQGPAGAQGSYTLVFQ
jgi:serine/threonine-protein kinase